MSDNQILIRRIAKNAIVLALYVALIFASFPLSFSGFQFRVSELLVLLCFFNRDYVIGITLGCFLSNFASPMAPWDLLIGTIATFISCLGVSFMKHLGIACLLPIICNSFIVGAEYYFILKEPYWFSVGQICLGETVIVIISYILCMILLKRENIQNIVSVNRNKDFKW